MQYIAIYYLGVPTCNYYLEQEKKLLLQVFILFLKDSIKRFWLKCLLDQNHFQRVKISQIVVWISRICRGYGVSIYRCHLILWFCIEIFLADIIKWLVGCKNHLEIIQVPRHFIYLPSLCISCLTLADDPPLHTMAIFNLFGTSRGEF